MTLLLGDSLKIIISLPGVPDNAKIDIYNPNGVKIISDDNIVYNENLDKWIYVYQNNISDIPGDYIFIIKITANNKTSRTKVICRFEELKKYINQNQNNGVE